MPAPTRLLAVSSRLRIRLASGVALTLLAAVIQSQPAAAQADAAVTADAATPTFVPGDRVIRIAGGNQPDLEIADQFDADGNGWLSPEERAAALAYLETLPEPELPAGAMALPAGTGPSNFTVPAGAIVRFGGPGGGADVGTPPEPGITLTPADIESYAGLDLYDTSVIRTIFIDFDVDTWEADMASFKDTDVRMPVTATVDGVTYELVGATFRGNSSFAAASDGEKRSIGLKFDFVVDDQAIEGYRTHNLLNSSGDPTMMRAALYSLIAQDYIPVPKVGFVRLVINGENWGIYQNQQQFNRDMLADYFPGADDGVRWQVPGSPGGGGDMSYVGDDIEAYRAIYEIDNRDTDASWNALINLFRVLEETPAEDLVAALEPIMDIDEVLSFLALDVAVANEDGYWTRQSDYYIYLAPDGPLSLMPHDMNEAFHAGGGFGPGGGGFAGGPGGDFTFAAPPAGMPIPAGPGPFTITIGPDGTVQAPGGGTIARRAGGPGGPGGPGVGATSMVELAPLVGVGSDGDTLRSKLLAVPELQKRYLEIMLDITQRWLDWDTLGAVAGAWHAMLDADVEQDTRKLSTYEAFAAGLDEADDSLKAFVEQRQAYLLSVLPDLIAAIPGEAYRSPDDTAAAAPATTASPAAGEAAVVSYAEKDGPDGWHFTAGTGSMTTTGEGTYFAFDALTDGFGASKLDQCIPIGATQSLSIAYSVYAAAPSANAAGLAVRVTPNFYADLAACEAAMAADEGGARLDGGRDNEDIDYVLGADDGQAWIEVTAAAEPDLAYAATDIPPGTTVMRLSLRARDRSGITPQPELRLTDISVTQGGAEIVANGSFAAP